MSTSKSYLQKFLLALHNKSVIVFYREGVKKRCIIGTLNYPKASLNSFYVVAEMYSLDNKKQTDLRLSFSLVQLMTKEVEIIEII